MSVSPGLVQGGGLSLGSLLAGLTIGLLVALAAFVLLRRRTSAKSGGEPQTAEQTLAGLQTPRAASGSTSTTQPSLDTDRLLHDIFPDGLPTGSPSVFISRPEVTGVTRTLTGDEAQRFLHDAGLEDTVRKAMGQTFASGTGRRGIPPTPLGSDDAKLRARHHFPVGVAIALGIGLLLFFGLRGLLRMGQPTHIGTFVSTGDALGNWTMDVDTCHTGMKRGFYGAQLFSSKDPRLSVFMVEDPLKGLAASVNSTTHDSSYTLTRQECTVLRGAAQNTGTTVNQHAVIQGAYEIECDVDGGHIAGKVEFKDCL